MCILGILSLFLTAAVALNLSCRRAFLDLERCRVRVRDRRPGLIRRSRALAARTDGRSPAEEYQTVTDTKRRRLSLEGAHQSMREPSDLECRG